MKTVLWIAGAGVLGFAAWKWYQHHCAEVAAQTMVQGANQAGGTSIFNEPDLEPMSAAATAHVVA